MKSLPKHIFCVVLILTYVLSYMGFGIHECMCEGTKDLILMMGDTSCEAIHSHTHPHLHTGCSESHTHPHIVGHHHGDEEGCCCGDHSTLDHNENCCNTNIYIVSADQDAGKDLLADIVVPEFTIEHSYFIIHNTTADLSAELYYDDAPPLSLRGGDPLSSLSVWRL